ncbi:unnamed protein product [Parnassius mnemosyne]|uniref:Uncharacterized protein n=1 Tax=Parnassius mnemosyne TaxID=213953 RepID=A0AAV1KH60_9NEOP
MTSREREVLSRLRTDHLNMEERINLENLCQKYADIFYIDGEALTFTNKIKHKIRTSDEMPVFTKSYRYPYIHRDEVRDQIGKMLSQGIIRPSESAWSSPIWIVPKKPDASGKTKWRLVVDFRKLNEKTIDDKYPIPNINDVLDKLGNCQYFSTLDLASGFYQVEMDPEDIPKTAFNVENGHYEFLRMPMGLKNSPSTFQRVMDNVLKGLQNVICLVYLDDIVVFSTSLQEHMINLEKVFSRLRESNFKVQMDKSEFLKRETAYLGHVITKDGIKPNPDKIRAIKNYPMPRTPKEIKQFLGLVGYYRKFIPNFARITKPFTQCLKKGNKVVINSEYTDCFEKCKNLLTNDPILQYPNFNKEFILTTDASNVALGAILSRGPEGADKPICYASRTLNDSELNYSTIEKELLAIWVMQLKEPNARLTRWKLKLSEYDFTVKYKSGKSNTNADALSRVEIHNEETDSMIALASERPPSVENSSTASAHTNAFSKYAQAYHVRDATAISIVQALLNFCTHHGLPLTIVSDNGTEFTNQIFNDFTNLHRINHHRILPHSPNDNGLVERFHATILEHIRILKLRNKSENAINLMPYAILAYNSSVHSFTKCRPFDIITGHFDPRDPFDVDMTKHLTQQYVQNHKDQMKLVYETLGEISLADRTSIINNRNKDRDPEIEYQPHQRIFVKNPLASRQKLAPRVLLVLTAPSIASHRMSQEITLESLDDGPGLLPFRLGATRLITHYHTFIQFVELDDINDKISQLQNQLIYFRQTLGNDTYMLYEAQIEFLFIKLSKVLNQLETLKPHRIKRGLVDGLGSIIKSVTGNLDNSDAVKYDNAIKILQQNSNVIFHEFNNHVSLSKEWMVQHSNVLEELVENQVKINETLQLILDRNSYKDSSLLKYAKFAQYLAILTENIDEIFSELTRIENIIAFIHASTLHHSMISIDVLNHMIQRLITIYGKEHVLQLELREYYDIIKPGYYYSDNRIVIIFNIPLFTKDSYNLYKLSMAPNKFKQALVPPFPLIATNRKGYVYIEAECPKFKDWYLCGETMDHQLRQVPDCIQNLLINQAIDKTCDVVTITLSRPAMEELDEKHYILSFPNATRIHYLCGKENYNILSGTYLATVPMSCSLDTPDFTITNINDVVEGQPLKIMKLTTDIEEPPKGNSQIHLNSIDLRRLHDTKHRVITQPTLEIKQASPDYTVYHTTIPLYIILLSALALTMLLLIRRGEIFRRRSERSPPKDKIYAVPETSEKTKQHPSLFSQRSLQK